MASVDFSTGVKSIPAHWAVGVNTLVYDVFSGAATVAGARTALGLGSMSLQDATAVAITGGTLDGVAIGGTAPGSGVFSTLRVQDETPSAGTDVVCLSYLNSRFSAFTTMAIMEANDVEFTGGVASGLAITGSSLNSSPVGNINPSTGRFTTLTVDAPLALTSGGTGAIGFAHKYIVYVPGATPVLGSASSIPIDDIQGAGTLARQNASSVALTGGEADNITLGTGCVFEGLGSMATQSSSSVNITGGTLANVTLVGVTRTLSREQVVGATTVNPLTELVIIDATGSDYIVDLPDPALVTKPMRFKKLGPAAISLRAPAGVTIDEHNIYNMYSRFASVTLVSDGTTYYEV